ncbi:hypothetical protein [Xanthomonas dyei]|uniref:hypothetical protein n=1 Tax=Xanthomonas dyei TaxID=743699 RepID=UPI001E36F72E|nr:hypothetical protein [Xanthomonas dyei]MCC4632652.1 hypothetical protein [Xanthomonas dyei pv. eucalypti]
MASIQRTGNKYRVQVYIHGMRDSTTKATRQEAVQWALEREAELRGTKLPDKTFDDALKRYETEVASARAGSRWELIRVKSLRRESDIAANLHMPDAEPQATHPRGA